MQIKWPKDLKIKITSKKLVFFQPYFSSSVYSFLTAYIDFSLPTFITGLTNRLLTPYKIFEDVPILSLKHICNNYQEPC